MKTVLLVVTVLLLCTSLRGQDNATILLPLGVFQRGGAFGSLWQTELAIRNTTSDQITISHAGALCSITCPFPAFQLSSGSSLLVTNPFNEPLISSYSGPAGLTK